jgi:hypothetical protein
MTQEPVRRPSSTHRRSARVPRNRPVLVTSTEDEGNEDSTPTLEESLNEVEAQNPPTAPSKRRLANFFSTVGKSVQRQAPQEVDTAQARLARATRGKASPARPSSSSEEKSEVTREKEPAKTTSPARPARPPSAFKTRYLIGMGAYLLGANFIGMIETSFFQSNHLDSVLTTFNLFGGVIVVKTSTLVYLATLVVLLVVLARLDLIPRNFSAMAGQTPSQASRRGGSSNTNRNTSENARNAPPTRKQGVKGANDDLYQEYRTNQRRRKK